MRIEDGRENEKKGGEYMNYLLFCPVFFCTQTTEALVLLILRHWHDFHSLLFSSFLFLCQEIDIHSCLRDYSLGVSVDECAVRTDVLAAESVAKAVQRRMGMASSHPPNDWHAICLKRRGCRRLVSQSDW